jgi:dynein heavy chain
MAGGGGTKTPAKPGAAKPTKEGGRAGRNIPGASAEEEAKTPAEIKMAFVVDRVKSTFTDMLGPKFDKPWQKPECQANVKAFIEDSAQLLVVTEKIATFCTPPEKAVEGKNLILVKLNAEPLPDTTAELKDCVISFEAEGDSVFEHLELICGEVFLPVLSNPLNQEYWGEVVTKDILDRFYPFMSSTTILCGQVQGQTRLPMPPTDAADLNVKKSINLLEGAIITWTKQIKSVLKLDPESQLKQGLHPTARVELAFWEEKANRLNSIYEQLNGQKIRRVFRVLDQHQSSYAAPLARLLQEVIVAREEANDNRKYLGTIKRWVLRLDGNSSFEDMTEIFKPMLHVILLIWKNSKHYNDPPRLMVLIREICNAIVNQAMKFVSGAEVFSLIEAEESHQAIEKLELVIEVCSCFKAMYGDYQSTANAECPNNPWRIQNNVLFVRLDSFLDRCHDILDMTHTIIQFDKLGRVEVGGTKGAELTKTVQDIYADFVSYADFFRTVKYELMDVGVKRFDDDFYDFRFKVKALERRLAAVMNIAFDDCTTVYGRFKLFDTFESVVHRPILRDEMEKKYIALLKSFDEELKNVQNQFLTSKDKPVVPTNYPPVSGALTWCRALSDRIGGPYEKLLELSDSILAREEATELKKVFDTIDTSLREFENLHVDEWARDVEATSLHKLELPLLTRNPETRHIQVNFDPALVCLLREVKYFLCLGLKVPKSARDLFEQYETFREWNGNLDLMVHVNNTVLQRLLPVEKPLLQMYLDKFDRAVEGGMTKLNWKMSKHDISEFIAAAMEQVQLVDSITGTMKENIRHMDEVMEKWAAPVMERKPKPVDSEEFDRVQKAARQTHYGIIKDGGKEIHNRLKDTNKELRVSNNSKEWRNYVDFCNSIVIDGLAQCITTSLEYLLDQLNPSTGPHDDEQLPMLEITLDLNLQRKEAKFVPPIESQENKKGLRDCVNNWIGGMFNVANMFKRLDGEGNYMRDMHSDCDVSALMAVVSVSISDTERRLADLKAQFEDHQELWTTDLDEYFAEFVADAVITDENGHKFIDLARYNEEIEKYETIRKKVHRIESPVDVTWLRVDTNPIKQALVSVLGTWIHQFTTKLKNHLVESLVGIDEFVDKANAGLDKEVQEGNKEQLMDVMRAIRDVKNATDSTIAQFEPLKECVSLLKTHGVDISDAMVRDTDVQDYLEDAPMHFNLVVKKTSDVHEKILQQQLAEADELKGRLDAFFLEMRKFRNDFRSNAPFNFTGSVVDAYSQMNAYATAMNQKSAEAAQLNELEELFEMTVSRYPEVADTKSELTQLKMLWDFKGMVEFTFEYWRNEKWNLIDTDARQAENDQLKKLHKQMGNDYPIIKAWNVYRDIEADINQMKVVLPLISDLHEQAMRRRHWQALSKVCGVKTINPDDPEFTMGNVWDLKLDEHVDDVSDIVETAMKELKVDNRINVIEGEWKLFELDYIQHKDTDMYLIKLPEEVMEALDQHQLDLQGMIGMGKFVDFFKSKIIEWQQTLGNVAEVTKVWELVGRSWASLESIFMASADIRSQLPDDTKRFEGIDAEFRELMTMARDTPNLVEACTVNEREETLRSMKTRLDLCQKSLNDYLDVKKKIFPRFYFVSSDALLDMLANGTNPPKILKYLGDCYDALNNVTFIMEEDGDGNQVKSNKIVNEMIAKDGEKCPLSEEFEMGGEVENYLNRLTVAMQTTLKLVMQKAYDAVGLWDMVADGARHKWLYHYPAQIVCTCSQIAWTEESENALEALEGGQEDAVKVYLNLLKARLAHLIDLVLDLTLAPADRVKIITLITLDVHARDVIEKLIVEKVEGASSFLWQQQLRFAWQNDTLDVNIRITDFQTKYFYEWVGNTGRLVITPLTDRCYITLCTGLRLFLGGAPAGPAGTGKTETTKDLARALALPCYVYNCSDQMNYQTMADIFKGLSQTGAWGCFDEFNRIAIEVLSVVATQVKVVQDAVLFFSKPENREKDYQGLPAGTPPVKVAEFDFFGDNISLIPTVSFYITMNPGYAGRTELPENLKVLFRSCAMIRPDLKPICENMLMSEGFQTAKELSVKFVTLYELSSELLSKQRHYDWGLRAVKSVLRVAGKMKREAIAEEPNLTEAQILMRALRDFNLPKIPAHDTPVFLRLISDLFMGIDVVSKQDPGLKVRAIHVAKNTNLVSDAGVGTPGAMFIQKVCSFQELLDVRHSVMLLGPTGCAKTTIWKTLANTHNIDPETLEEKRKKTCITEVVNPKAVSGDELYGYMTLAKDWKDGVLSIIMRGMAKNFPEQNFYEYQTYKWVVLDGDIDAVWIESMNTVMDDNKVLTLVSNERVPLSAAMRMVFEINSLSNATPATVSRAGILYINETDVGWKPMVESWVNLREDPVEKAGLLPLFDKYIEGLEEMTRRGYKEVTPCRIINKVSTIMSLMDAMLRKLPPESKTDEIMDMLFQFAAVWAFGGPQTIDKQTDFRNKFSEDFKAQFGQKYPKEGSVFDYFYDPETDEHVHWETLVPEYQPILIGPGPNETPFTSVSVASCASVSLTHVLDLLARHHNYAMLVGGAGTGKTLLIKEYLRTLDKDADGLLSSTITMSYFTDSKKLQGELELSIDKRAGRMYGPAAGKTLIYFIDDLNLPYIETYGTQNAIALLTQLMGHRFTFDRQDVSLRKEIVDTQYIAAMNPTAGSFTVCERAQRHFSTFNCAMPGISDLNTIYTAIFQGHLNGFGGAVASLCDPIVDATLQLHQAVQHKFLPSAVKFTYNWNMRELANIFQNLCLSHSSSYTDQMDMLRLWLHETQRVFEDRLVSEAEHVILAELTQEVAKKTFDPKTMKVDLAVLFQAPVIYTNFADSQGGEYLPLSSGEKLRTVLNAKLVEYNEANAMMDLVLFDMACYHVSRIARILANPGGNAMLIGVGGSGKQSLCKLASFISGYEVQQIQVTGSYGIEDLKEDLRSYYNLAIGKNTPVVFLMTDGQIIDDHFLVYLNAMLSSGWISDLFPKEDIDNLIGSLRNDAKAAAVPDNPEAMFEFLVKRCRSMFKCVLAFSPVGDTFKKRAQRFPALINCVTIDVFHPWPRDALESVAMRFLAEVEFETNGEELRDKLSKHMAEQHLSTGLASVRYKQTQKRFNYVTPKSFLELIEFYKTLLTQKRDHVQKDIDRLDIGLSTLRKTAQDVAELKVDLEHTMAKVAEKKEATDALIADMGVQQKDADEKKLMADEEAVKANDAAAKAGVVEAEAEVELAKAKPAMDAAAAAVDCLSKAMLGELKNLKSPPAGVDKVTKCCLILIDHEYKNHKWDRAKKMMGNVDKFLQTLKDYDGSTIPEDEVEKVAVFVEGDPEFTYENMSSKSAAAANLCNWVINIYTYNRIYVRVKPLMDSLEEAQATKKAALESLATAEGIVAAVEAKLKHLAEVFEQATREKAEVEANADACMAKLGLAERLVGGLASENERWGTDIEKLKVDQGTLVGDCMLASGFVSYVGAFDQQNREALWKELWIPDLKQREMPMSDGIDPLQNLLSESMKASMIGEGLPNDRVSLENGGLIANCKRWPLIVDPQLQGIKWIRNREAANNLTVFQLSTKNWMRKLEGAITNGHTVIIENIQEEIDATLDPVLARAIYKKGRNFCLKLGGEEVEYDLNFKLYLQTKLANPHYKPEIAAQCTLINFIATERGLEDQLLAKVVGKERPDLEERSAKLQAEFTAYRIELLELEDNLLERLANAPDDILSDIPLIEGLEATKKTVSEINAAIVVGKKMEVEIATAREVYRTQASEGAMLYFMLTKLCSIEHMYQYSLDSFVTFFFKSIDKSPPGKEVKERVANLTATLRMTIFTWVSRGLFERHKLIFMSQLCFNLMRRGDLGEDEQLDEQLFNFLLQCPRKVGEDNPLTWLPLAAWQSICALSELEDYGHFNANVVEAAPRFREWFNHVTPESEKLPLDWAALDRTPFKKMLVVRCLRPDRMALTLSNYIRSVLPNGGAYADCDAASNSVDILEQSINDSTPQTPIYFILSPGANAVADLDKLAVLQDPPLVKGESYHNVSMGQGQDVVAERALELAHRNGHWVILNNIHLMPRWLVDLEKKLDDFGYDSHERFRLFLTSDPSNSIPIGLLARAIKLTNEPPGGLKANLKRAFCFFTKEQIDEADQKTKGILFGLCVFHAVMMERKMYGPMGYNMMYPFSLGDLRDSSVCLANYMENSGGGKIPWADLKYIFGEIMYGGHIVNDFDRLMANTYLDFYMEDGLLDEKELYPFAEDEKDFSFTAPGPLSYEKYIEHIDTGITQDSPIAFGLHPNAEIDFRTAAADKMFKALVELQPRGAGAGGDEGGQSPAAMAESLTNDIIDRFADVKFEPDEIGRALDDVGPYQNVFMQEMAWMNVLITELIRSLQELLLGFAGELTMSDAMEDLQDSLFLDRVPGSWAKRAWPSLMGLALWLNNFKLRLNQLEDWQNNPMELPKVTWLSGLVNPQSFLTAICQVAAQKNSWELDKLVSQTEVTKKMKAEEIDMLARDGAFISGASMQGARWDGGTTSIEKSRPKEMFCDMPVMNVKGIGRDKADTKGVFMCPVYKTEFRGPTFVFRAQIKTKSAPARWILGGVALILEVS